MITQSQFIRTLRGKSVKIFNYGDVFTLFGLESENAVNSLLTRLKKKEIISWLAKGKYAFLLASAPAGDFEIANFLYPPSYVSLESALSYYGIIDQFPYQITSVTVNKARKINVQGKEYVYAQVRPEFFRDYNNEGGVLIASKVKSVFDYLYLSYKGGRGRGNLKLLNFSRGAVTKAIVRRYIMRVAKNEDKNFINFCKKELVL